jgi:ABC-type transport system involved in cytochrome c biogenesis permease subunit
MKKLPVIMFAIAALFLLCMIVSSCVFALDPLQHDDGEDFGIISFVSLIGAVSLVSFVFKAQRLNQSAHNKQLIMSFFYCGWQNSAYDTTLPGLNPGACRA